MSRLLAPHKQLNCCIGDGLFNGVSLLRVACVSILNFSTCIFNKLLCPWHAGTAQHLRACDCHFFVRKNRAIQAKNPQERKELGPTSYWIPSLLPERLRSLRLSMEKCFLNLEKALE